MGVFDEHLADWRAYTATPWARIRYAVVRRTLTDSLASLGPGPFRVLDVGGGDGLDALPLAAAGHQVTLLDPSEQMLELARQRAAAEGAGLITVVGGLDDLASLSATPFDLVLCHFVLQYREVDLVADLARLVAATRPGGLLSLIAPNPASAVLTRLLRDSPAAALAELDRDTAHTVTFDHEVRKLSVNEVEALLSRAGCRIAGRFGGRIANDLVVDDARKDDPSYFADLEALELALCDQEPFWRIGAFWQLVARRLG